MGMESLDTEVGAQIGVQNIFLTNLFLLKNVFYTTKITFSMQLTNFAGYNRQVSAGGVVGVCAVCDVHVEYG